MVLEVAKLFQILQIAKQSYGTSMLSHIVAMQNTDTRMDCRPKGLILGVYTDTIPCTLTASARRYNSELANGKLPEAIQATAPITRPGDVRVIEPIEQCYEAVALVGLQADSPFKHPYEVLDEQRENIRRAVEKACVRLSFMDVSQIDVESFGHAESAAIGATLGLWPYVESLNPKSAISLPSIQLYQLKGTDEETKGWLMGLEKAAAQNLKQTVQELAGNFLSPIDFAKLIVDLLRNDGINVEIKISDWQASEPINDILALANEENGPPLCLELNYNGGHPDDDTLHMVANEVCRSSNNPDENVHDCLITDLIGAAGVVAAFKAITALQLSLNMKGIIPLCRGNMEAKAFNPKEILKHIKGEVQMEPWPCACRQKSL